MSGFFLIKGDDPGGSDRTEIRGPTLVGRGDDAALKVTEGHPSRRHAMLTLDDDGLWVEDLGSANGTTVNGQRIASRTLLYRGDRVAFDLASFVVEAPEAEAVDDADVTVIRRSPEPDATVMRPATPAAAAPEAAAAAPEPAPAAPRFEAEALQSHVPRSWADPDYQGEGTRILSAEEMRALAEGGGNAPATPGEAPAPMHIEGPHLVIVAGPAAGMAFALVEGRGEWTIGTAEERDIRLEFSGVSAYHAKIVEESGRWRIIDQMSANGTWVNGHKTTISYLQQGDKLRFAQVECEIRLYGSAARAKSPASSRPGKAKGSGAGRRNLIIGLVVAAATGAALWLASNFL
ncbi:MAG: FHA domain-containing protein [Pseudomonadales bacterium]